MQTDEEWIKEQIKKGCDKEKIIRMIMRIYFAISREGAKEIYTKISTEIYREQYPQATELEVINQRR